MATSHLLSVAMMPAPLRGQSPQGMLAAIGFRSPVAVDLERPVGQPLIRMGDLPGASDAVNLFATPFERPVGQPLIRMSDLLGGESLCSFVPTPLISSGWATSLAHLTL